MSIQEAVKPRVYDFVINDIECKKLCLELIKADNEGEVISALKKRNLWDDPVYWRDLGDNDSNYGVAGNQQVLPEAAIAEKIVNSIDARLTGECKKRGINPEDPDKAPKNMREAAAEYIENHPNPRHSSAGKIMNWSKKKRLDVALGTTLAATGDKSTPAITVSDIGEGQTPRDFPDTFLSLLKGNKNRVLFVQGQYNQGGTGVLRHSGPRSLQLIISKKDPEILNMISASNKHASDDNWGFTIIREDPPAKNEKNPVYRYLAPVKASKKPSRGEVLNFFSETLSIFPEKTEAYGRESTHGSMVKIYEYNLKGRSSNIILKSGLMRNLEALLVEPALPIRFFECREHYTKGKKVGSFANNLVGVLARLLDKDDDEEDSPIEAEYTLNFPIRIGDSEIGSTVFAFKEDRDQTYRKRTEHGVLFVENGQAQGALSVSFFKNEKRLKFGYLAESLLAVIDCTNLERSQKGNIFGPSRDKLFKSSDEYQHIISQLVENIENSDLKNLETKRREEKKAKKFEDEKPLEETFNKIFRHSPSLFSMFLSGSRLSNPFKPKSVASNDDEPKEGKKFPTYFRFKGKKQGDLLNKNTPINKKARIQFETDARNDYFDERRGEEKGDFELYLISDEKKIKIKGFTGPSLSNGNSYVSIPFPEDTKVGDNIRFQAVINDYTQREPFINDLCVVVGIGQDSNTGTRAKNKSKTDDPGNDREQPSGISLPNIVEVFEKDWDIHKFDKFSALKVVKTYISNPETDEAEDTYDFFINMDNIHLLNEIKAKKTTDLIILRKQYSYALTLIGLSILHEAKGKNQDFSDVEDDLFKISRAISPVLLPMINQLGTLDD